MDRENEIEKIKTFSSIKEEDFLLILESIEDLASKDKSDEDYELMKKAVSGMWANITQK